jgi:hypothetical protein
MIESYAQTKYDTSLDDSDLYGAELSKDARVWRVYVKEADRHDTELVDGWNKFDIHYSLVSNLLTFDHPCRSLDVILGV